MKEKFKDILNTDKVEGVVLVSFDGKIVYESFNSGRQTDRRPDKSVWASLVPVLQDVREADLLYENMRIYLRKTPVGHLFVLMDFFGSMAMLRLQCDLLLPTLKEKSSSRSLFKWLRKKG